MIYLYSKTDDLILLYVKEPPRLSSCLTLHDFIKKVKTTHSVRCEFINCHVQILRNISFYSDTHQIFTPFPIL